MKNNDTIIALATLGLVAYVIYKID